MELDELRVGNEGRPNHDDPASGRYGRKNQIQKFHFFLRGVC